MILVDQRFKKNAELLLMVFVGFVFVLKEIPPKFLRDDKDEALEMEPKYQDSL